jgi:hypothetical protein
MIIAEMPEKRAIPTALGRGVGFVSLKNEKKQ